MKSIRKRFVAIILLAVMVFSDFQMSTSLAMDNSSAVEETEVAETDAANTVKAENRLNYILVESPYLESPNTQNIVVSWGDGTEQISNMRIAVQKEDGSTEEWTCSNQSGYLYVFSKEYVDESEQSTYKVTDIRFKENQQEQCFLLTDLKVEAEFGVNKAYDGIEELQPLDPEDAVETSIVTIDENGETEAQDNIASALTAVSEEMGAAAGIRSAEKAGEIVVALDPGHDNRHGGTSGSGLTEQELTLKIAKYAKAELETYNGVKVYMTRTTAACPYPETGTSGACIEKRVQAAAKAGAKIYVSLHLNSGPASANGAEIIIPNSSWKPQLSTQGKELAEKILNELTAVGLNKRPTPIYSKDTTVNEKYPDGSISDYYSVQICAKEAGIPGIIVEHAFLSNTNDVNKFLKTEAGLKKLGVADATGIAKYLGLSKETNLRLDTTNYNGVVGGTYQFLAITNNRNGVPTVSVSDSSVVSVSLKNANDSRGYLYEIKGKKAGSAVITVKHGGKTATLKVIYKDNNYSLDTKDMEYPANKVYQFLAKITDKSQGTPSVRSSNTSVATVSLKNANDSRGYLFEVQTKKAGKAKITVNYLGVERSFTITVLEETTLKLDTTNYNGVVGGTYQFLAITNNRRGVPTVSVSDSSVVSVSLKNANDSRGYLYEIKGKKAGSAVITVKHDGKTATLKVTYKDNNYSLDTKDMEYPANKVYQFLAKITDKSQGAPTVKSSNTSVAVVSLKNANDSRGYLFEVQTKKAGKAKITVNYLGVERSFTITVLEETTLKLDTVQYTGSVGTIYQFLAITNNRNGVPTVSVSDSSVVSVALKNANDSRGYLYEIKGKKAGTAVITVKHDGKTATLKVTYKDNNYSLDTKDMEYPANRVYQFLAKITDKTQGTPTAESSNTSVAIVSLKNANDSRGYLFEVQTKKAGKTKITVNYLGVERSFTITVLEETTLKLDTKKYSGTAGEIYQFLAITNNRNGVPTVSVSDSSVVSVSLKNANDSRGFLYEIQGKKAGNATITVKHDGKTATLPVTYKEVDYKLDSGDMNYPENKVYQFLAKITDKTKGTPTVSSSDASVATVSLKSANDSRGYLYEVKTKRPGKATITVEYFGTKRSFTITVTQLEKYGIAGQSTVSVQQMVKYFNSKGKEYPTKELSKGGAKNISEFCQIFYEEANAEGIKAEVAFAQTMLETGYLQFGGDVKAEQFNFCGLGATGGVAGADFSSYGNAGVRTGIRAQIQHLKCYANSEPLNNACVDPRWGDWLREKAPYVEWLGQKENPYGTGWATSENYGYNIKKIIYEIKEF